MSLYAGYFAEGFALDPSGTKKDDNPNRKKFAPNIYEYSPNEPNTNSCDNSCNLILKAKQKKGGNKYIPNFEKKLPNATEFNGTKGFQKKLKCPDNGKIKYLLIGAHGEANKILLGDKWVRKEKVG